MSVKTNDNKKVGLDEAKVVFLDFLSAFSALEKEDQSLMYFYAHREFEKITSLLTAKPQALYECALYSIRGRFPEAEEIILQDERVAYFYARDVIQGRWPEAEGILAKHPKWAYWYANEALRQQRFPDGEGVIAQEAEWAYWYAWKVIQGRWPEGEAAILKSAEWAYKYAKNVIQGRWLEAEPVIAQYAVRYENTIYEDSQLRPSGVLYRYMTFTKTPIPDCESILETNPAVHAWYKKRTANIEKKKNSVGGKAKPPHQNESLHTEDKPLLPIDDRIAKLETKIKQAKVRKQRQESRQRAAVVKVERRAAILAKKERNQEEK